MFYYSLVYWTQIWSIWNEQEKETNLESKKSAHKTGQQERAPCGTSEMSSKSQFLEIKKKVHNK